MKLKVIALAKLCEHKKELSLKRQLFSQAIQAIENLST